MLEIIKRREGERHEKTQVCGINVQVSFNDWGHLCVRVIQAYDKCTPLEADTLLVFDSPTSAKIVNFCERISGRDLPF